MNHKLWEAYLAIGRKVESGGRNDDWGNGSPANVQMQQGFVDLFRQHLKPLARVLAPGAMREAVILAQAGYEVWSLLLGPDNVAKLAEEAAKLRLSERLHVLEQDAHDLTNFEEGFFDGYFTVQFHEHLIAPCVHIGEVFHVMRPGGVLFVDACGTTNDACKMIWHTNLVPERTVLEQWQFWGFKEIWRGPYGDDRPQFILERRPADEGKNAGYLQWISRLRRGEEISYLYHCAACKRG